MGKSPLKRCAKGSCGGTLPGMGPSKFGDRIMSDYLSNCVEASRGRLARRVLKAREEGSALVEMAVALPLMMFLITGLCFLGLAIDNYLILTHAADVGARYLAVGRGQLTDPCAQTVTVIQNAAPGLSTSKLSYSFTIGSSGAVGTASPSTCSSATTYMTPQATAIVTVSYTYPVFIYGWSTSHQTLSMQASTAEMVQ